MKKILLLTVLLVVGNIALMNAADMKFALPQETVRLKAAPGAELATAQCLLCHSADYISTQPKLGRAAWKASVVKMQQKYGAPIQTNTIDRIVDYLVRNYGAESPTSGLPGK